MKRRNEKGQATIELILILLPISACILGILFIGGITVSNNERFLASKFEAEKKAQKGDTADIEYKPMEFFHWSGDGSLHSYLKKTFGIQGKLNLPFGLDYSSNASTLNTLQDVEYRLKNSADSKKSHLYYWEETGDYDIKYSSSTQAAWNNAFNAAQLVSGHRSQSYNDKDLNDFTDKATRKAAQSWLGITVSNSDIRQNRSNHVYMPIVKKDKKIME